MTEEKPTIGERLRTARGKRSMQTVAEAVGITTQALSMYEHDKRVPRDEIKVRLAAYYKRSIATLFF